MDASGVAETLRQIRDGRDFSPPKAILRISASTATAKLPGWPYSIAGNVGHAVYWQELWLAKLRGEPRSADFGQNWPNIAPADWEKVRSKFLIGLDQAIAFAERNADPVTLARIAHHNAYHVGQWALLKRLLRNG